MNRSERIRSLPCIACNVWIVLQQQPTEEHHLNLGGKAGQKRRGKEYSIPLCIWHHRGEPPMYMTAMKARLTFGPSLARNSKEFRGMFGTDDELLASTNKKLRIENVN